MNLPQKHLQLDDILRNSWFAKYIKNVRIVLLLVFTIIAIGVSSLLTLSRRLNPEVKLTIVTVVTVLPGAGPADTESLITIPLENKLLGVKGLDTITSSSLDNASVITMQFLSGVDKDKAKNDVQSLVNEVTTLPADAKTPTVTALDFEGTPIWQFTLTSTGETPSLMRFADELKNKIEDVYNVDKVELSGFDTEQIQVKVNLEKIHNLGIDPMRLAQVLKNATQSFPAGSVKTRGMDFSVAINNDVQSVEDIRNLILMINGKPVRLSEIAEISFKAAPDTAKTYIATVNDAPRQSVTFSVYKVSSADIGKTVHSVEQLVNDEISKSNGRYKITTITNTGEDINKQFNDVISEFRSTLVLVFINLLLFLGLRQALIASITIPLTFLLSFGWMSGLGQSINFITLFALLLAFGTSIDDTIVTVSAMTTYHKDKNLSSYEAGILVWKDFVTPIWTTTITTVWAFLPLILSSGIIGEFIKPIPITVATTMYSSTAVAWFITLPLMIVFLNPVFPNRVKKLIKALFVVMSVGIVAALSPKNALLLPIIFAYVLLLAVTFRVRKQLWNSIENLLNRSGHVQQIKLFFEKLFSKGFIDTEKLGEKYQHLIKRIVSSRSARRTVLISIVIYAITSYALIPLGLVKNEFFPKTNENNIYINVEMPTGTDTKELETEAKNLLEQLRSTRETQAVLAEPGTGINERGNGTSSANSILFSLILTPKEERKITSIDISEELRTKFKTYSKGKFSVVELGSGPPAGADVQIKLLGDDLNTLDQYANKVKDYLATQPGIINIDKTSKSGTSKIVFVPNKSEMAKYGINADTIGYWLRLAVSGFTLDTVRLNDKDNDIVFYVNGGKISPEDLSRITIPLQGDNVPLLALGTLELKNNPTVITREGGKRVVSISAGVQKGHSVSDANTKLINYAKNGLYLPTGYTWQTGGVNEENTKSVQSIFRAMGLSFILIMATMVIEFGSFRQAAMVLSLIPFAISGVFYVFGLTGTPLSFPALIGVLALFGVVVTNAMFIVEKINQNLKQGMVLDDAIADAGQSRLEPIILTSLTSILGLVPITLANELWRGLGGAIISGLMFSGIIMLFYIPVMYKYIYSERE